MSVPARRTALVAAAVLASTLLAAPTAPAATHTGTGCAAVEIIGARATGERPGMGQLLGPLATSIQRSLTSPTAIKALSYPASFDYVRSVNAGTAALTKLLTDEVARCPSINLVVLGYSQGAQVVGNTFDSVGPQLSSTVKARVRVVELFGDPAFNGDEAYGRGSFTPSRDGIFPRPTSAFPWAAGRTQSFCEAGDNVCQRGDRGTAHYSYGARSEAARTHVLAALRR